MLEELEIIEVKTFSKAFDNLVGRSERLEFHEFLRNNPESGVIIPGTKGLRKVRWSRPGSGKRGGVRIIYYLFLQQKELYLFEIYAKSDKESILAGDIKVIMQKVEKLKMRSLDG